MKAKKITKILGLIIGFYAIINFAIEKYLPNQDDIKTEIKTSGAGQAMDMWSYERTYPNNKIDAKKLTNAFLKTQQDRQNKSSQLDGEWESLGPKNIGGRTLCLAFHPTNENIIFAGSASGGLWKTTTQGVGQDAWEYVPIGFPVLGVASIAIDSNNSDIMFIGTGEVYGSGYAEPGTVIRQTRGTYGIGVLKSIDGGNSWIKVLNFNENQLVGINDLTIDPQNSQNIFAATSVGLYRSTDVGNNWTMVLNQPDCFDLEIDKNDANIIYVTQGNFNSALNPALSGVFKSTNGGDSFFEILDAGLIAAWSGSARIKIDPNNSSTVYASIQVGFNNNGSTTPAGIYKSTNSGVNWTRINNQNIAQFQGWYSHGFDINPQNSNELIYVGIATWKSTNTGVNFSVQSSNTWTFGVQVPVEIPEGGDFYVHSDIHAVYYHPINNKVFYATDGGVFVSNNGEQPFTTLNGGLQTLQFYADMDSSVSDPNFCIVGAQDNATYVYKGSPSWWREIGGDGGNAIVNKDDDQIVFGSWQGLQIQKSTNNGNSFVTRRPTLLAGDYAAFIAPFELAPSNQNIMYAGTRTLYKSIDLGENWNATTTNFVANNDVITKIAIAPTNPDFLFVTTSHLPTFTPVGSESVLKSINGGQNFTQMTGLPNRVAKDIEFDPNDENTIYITFSGFGSNHVYKTTNAGTNWVAIDNGLPDLPTNTILIDPLNSSDLYIGNDLGVYYSNNGGDSWTIFSDALPEATMVYDLNNSPANRKIRIATHGHGMYQRSYVNDPLSVANFETNLTEIKVYPNPTRQQTKLQITSKKLIENVRIDLMNTLGQKIKTVYNGKLNIGNNSILINNLNSYNSGVYFIKIHSNKSQVSKRLILK